MRPTSCSSTLPKDTAWPNSEYPSCVNSRSLNYHGRVVPACCKLAPSFHGNVSPPIASKHRGCALGDHREYLQLGTLSKQQRYLDIHRIISIVLLPKSISGRLLISDQRQTLKFKDQKNPTKNLDGNNQGCSIISGFHSVAFLTIFPFCYE